MRRGRGLTKPYEFIGFGAMEVTKPYEFIGFGAMDVTKPYEFIGFGASFGHTGGSFKIMARDTSPSKRVGWPLRGRAISGRS